VLQHARHALQALEAQAQNSRSQVDLFAPPPEPIDAGPSPLQARLAQLDPDTLTPREALDALYQLKKLT
jgi:DNA mismatch repair protein MutS